MTLPFVVYWLILAGPMVHSTIPFDTMDKCEAAGKDITEKFRAKESALDLSNGPERIVYVCQRDIIDIPALEYLLR